MTAADLAARDAKLSEMGETMAELRGMLQGLSSLAQQSTAAPAIPDHPEITAEQITEAIRNADDGNPGAAIKALIDRATSEERRRADERLAQLQKYGIDNFTQLAEAQVSQRPNFKRFEKEIRSEIARLDPASRGLSQAWDYAYNLVVGRHATELANETVEEALRKARESGGFAANTPSEPEPAKLSSGEPVPTVREAFGSDAEEALKYRKLDADRLAQRMGYEGGWSQYIDQLNTLVDPYEDDKFMFPKGKSRGPSFRGARRGA